MEIKDPAFNYDKYGQSYSGQRQTDPRIETYIYQALGQSATVLNVGAGAGSYEPKDRYVVAIEPSVVMRSQRIANNKVPAVNARADAWDRKFGHFRDQENFTCALRLVIAYP